MGSVKYFDKVPPYGAIAASKFAGATLELKPDPSHPKADPALLSLDG